MKDRFLEIINELEEKPVMTESVYELKNLRGEYSDQVYINVMDEIHSEDYDAAREIIQDLD